jgi:hypothetical protein
LLERETLDESALIPLRDEIQAGANAVGAPAAK